MTIRRRLTSVLPIVFLLYSSWIPAMITAAVVTLDSIEIFNTHEIFGFKPTVYFRCKGENKTILPDVKEKNRLFSFKGEESWQPLTELLDKKCKRCGFYEEDTLKSDAVFDEWEFCASEFTSADGKYTHFKEKEFNATFLCPECVPLVEPVHSDARNEKKGMHWTLILLITVLVMIVLLLGGLTAYKYWQKRRRQREQARFLRLFDEVDDIEDELGIGPLTNVV